MEEFRPLIADSTMITLFNKKELSDKDFIQTGLGVSLTTKAKKKVIAGYKQQMVIVCKEVATLLPAQKEKFR